jgi:hypothetical protein
MNTPEDNARWVQYVRRRAWWSGWVVGVASMLLVMAIAGMLR